MRVYHKLILSAILHLSFLAAFAQQPDPPGQVNDSTQPKNEAYLFAHMIHSDYGRLYYTVSRDGLHWTSLNGGKRVFEEYKGHPDICKGHDGRYYLVGNQNDASPVINFWVSDDLITWEKYNSYTPDLKSTPDYSEALQLNRRSGCGEKVLRS